MSSPVSPDLDGEPDVEEEDDPGAWWADESTDELSRLDVLAGYAPRVGRWEGKSILRPGDPAAIAGLRWMVEVYPEYQEMSDELNTWIDDLLESRTSIEGSSRKDFRKIFQSMFGSWSGEGDGGGFVMNMLGASQDDD